VKLLNRRRTDTVNEIEVTFWRSYNRHRDEYIASLQRQLTEARGDALKHLREAGDLRARLAVARRTVADLGAIVDIARTNGFLPELNPVATGRMRLSIAHWPESDWSATGWRSTGAPVIRPAGVL
jgi:hypothetical protein